MSHNVACIVAHPDDEVLACGASLALHANAKDLVSVLILSTGLGARNELSQRSLLKLRDQARRAADLLGVTVVEFGEFPDNAMDTVPLLDVIQRVEGFISEFPADIIYTHHAGDLNVDHRVVNAATLTACRPLPGRGHSAILACEVSSSTEWGAPPFAPFLPSEFIDVSSTIETKMQALQCYEGELRPWPHPRSLKGVKSLAEWRGVQVGLDAAEAFMTLRRIRS
tara:strand:+ start:2871 stop:3545 length:675 start_codon:yes stop_codon:yes gene_type:complete